MINQMRSPVCVPAITTITGCLWPSESSLPGARHLWIWGLFYFYCSVQKYQPAYYSQAKCKLTPTTPLPPPPLPASQPGAAAILVDAHQQHTHSIHLHMFTEPLAPWLCSSSHYVVLCLDSCVNLFMLTHTHTHTHFSTRICLNTN